MVLTHFSWHISKKSLFLQIDTNTSWQKNKQNNNITMKKINAFLLTLGVTLACTYNAYAQTLLDEDFETNTTQSISQPITVGEG